ncbi:MAG: GntR family transcriptional regulator [Acidobacteria bacterium]|nr:GntR family transcriptional regulator [Acidobacteriota bacterium]
MPHSKLKYQNVLEQLRQDIAEGRFRPGQKLPGEAALVQRFGVSRITVGHAVRELQRGGLIDRIPGSGTYVRGTPRAAEGLVFGLIIPNLGETEIFEPVCQAIAAAPDAAGHALLWPHTDARLSRDEQAMELCAQCIARGVAGVFFAPLELSPHSREVNRKVLKLLREAGIPVVLLDRRPEPGGGSERYDLVGIDNYRAGYLATMHLRRQGTERIAFVGYQHQADTVRARIAGYQDALERTEAPRVYLLPEEDQMSLSIDMQSCQGFVCANDRVAARLMRGLIANRWRVPEEMRVVGMDDVRYASLLPVPLTTVHQPCGEIGETALRLMLDRLERPHRPAREVLVDCDLVVRESCGEKLKSK